MKYNEYLADDKDFKKNRRKSVIIAVVAIVLVVLAAFLSFEVAKYNKNKNKTYDAVTEDFKAEENTEDVEEITAVTEEPEEPDEPEVEAEPEELPLAERIASSDIVIVEAGVAIDDTARDGWMEIGESYANKKLDKYQLAEMLNAICYGFDWTDVKTANLDGFNDFTSKYTTFINGMDQLSLEAFTRTLETIYKEGFQEGIDLFFTDYFEFNEGYENYVNVDLVYSMYKFYVDNLEGNIRDFYDSMCWENIINFPFDELADGCDLYNTKLYNSMYLMYYGISNGYEYSHVIDLQGDLSMYEAFDSSNKIQIMHAIPMVINGDENNVRALLVALLDKDYNVVDVISYNTELDNETFVALATD